jgi:serine/threonine protein kinase
MKPDRWRQIENLYHAALELKADERARFFDEACAGDETLRSEIESLLAYEGRAEGFIESPAIELAASLLAEDQTDSAAGKKLGPYEVLSLLAAGGMGEVYLAEDARLDRKVALKLLPNEFTQDQERLKRFEREARAASALNHPNILTIYDIGRADDIQYIATARFRRRTKPE